MDELRLMNEKIDENWDEMITTLQELLSIRSVVEESDGEFPFGAGVQEAFAYMLNKSAEAEFHTVNIDNYGGHADMKGTGDGIMGIVGHLDVVPEGSGWEDAPYSGTMKDNKIYGRGTMDDKGPVIAAFYAMKAIQDAGIQLKNTVRLIFGLDEETQWEGMRQYLSKVAPPDFGFTPDGDFPAIHGEKGILVFQIAKKIKAAADQGLELRSLKGGQAPNMVADYARAVVRNSSTNHYDEIKELAAKYRKEKDVRLNCKGIGKSLEISAQGISSHGAKPEQGVNAISIIMDFLGQLPFVNEDAKDFIDFYNHHIGFELDGQSLGCGFSDEASGKLILNVGMIEMDTKAASVTINVRYPVTVKFTEVYEGMASILNRYNLGVVKGKQQDPIYLPADHPMITTLMEIYRKHSGDQDSQPLVIGGGTYARAMKNVIAFGARFPGEPELGHQKNECLSLESLKKMTQIYGEAIYRLGNSVDNIKESVD